MRVDLTLTSGTSAAETLGSPARASPPGGAPSAPPAPAGPSGNCGPAARPTRLVALGHQLLGLLGPQLGWAAGVPGDAAHEGLVAASVPKTSRHAWRGESPNLTG